MTRLALLLLVFPAPVTMLAQQNPVPASVGGRGANFSELSNLPVARIGDNDLIGISVYDSPELTRTVRVNPDGDILLPMVKRPIHAAGLYPHELEERITASLIDDHVLVEPLVTVSIVEYRSRPITVVGEVKMPTTFQAMGNETLLDAISRAEGLTEHAGSEILVSRQVTDADGKPAVQMSRIPVRALLDGTNATLNLNLQGGDIVRVPEAGRVFVVGNVKKPGAFYISDGSQSSVLKALALSEGLDSFSSHTAYIYRSDDSGGERREIPIELKKILVRKSPDVALLAGDILYIPDASGAKASLKALEASMGIGSALGAAFIYYGTR